MAPKIDMPDEAIRKFAVEQGALEVWRSWRDNMLAQGRGVPQHRMQAATLPANDLELDANISFDVIRDFIVWYNDHAA